MINRRVAALCLVPIVLVTGCGASQVGGSGHAQSSTAGSTPAPASTSTAASSATTPTTSTSAAVTSPAESALGSALTTVLRRPWVTTTDAADGLRFDLPHAPKTQRRPPASGLTRVEYSDQFDAQAGASVLVITTPSASTARSLAAVYLDEFAATFTKAGVRDAKILERGAVRYRGYSGFDGRLFFTPLTPSGVPYAWPIRVLAVRRHLVVLFTLVIPPDSRSEYLARARAVQKHLVQSLSIT